MDTPGNSDRNVAEILETTRTSAGVTGALAAELLAAACRRSPEYANELQLEVVRKLAQDLKKQLETLARSGNEPSPVDALVDGALCCADLANLAVCALPELPDESSSQAAAAVHLAAGAARAFGTGVETWSGAFTEARAANVLRDARSVSWRVGLAIRQVEEASEIT